MDDGTYKSEARRWWARPWGALRKRDRRRLRSRPDLRAAHGAWRREHDKRHAESVFRSATVDAVDNPFLRAFGSTPFEGTGDVLGAGGPISFEENN